MTILFINVSQKSDFVEKPYKRSNKKEDNFEYILAPYFDEIFKYKSLLFSDLTLDSASICLAISAKTCILLPCM